MLPSNDYLPHGNNGILISKCIPCRLNVQHTSTNIIIWLYSANDRFCPDRSELLHTNWDNSWWRHQMETFSAFLAICAGNSPVPGEFPTQRPVTRSFDVFFDLCPNRLLNKQWWGWWFGAQSCPLWRHTNDCPIVNNIPEAHGYTNQVVRITSHQTKDDRPCPYLTAYT